MKKNNVWKQALALALSATLVLGNVSPVSAADGDAGTSEGAGNQEQVTNMDAYEPLTFTADGVVSGDNAYVESGITFTNKGVTIVDDPDEGGTHGKVFKFSTGTQKVYNDPKNIPQTESTTGVTYLTSVENALTKYDFSNGVSFSFDIYPDQQATDWNYLFVAGEFEADPSVEYTSGAVRNTVTGTIGFVAAGDSQKKGQENNGNTWMMYVPQNGWINGDRQGYRWNYFVSDQDILEGESPVADNIHKWYTLKYVYTEEGLTISINGTPVISYFDTQGYIKDILSNMNKGHLRLGKGMLTTLEGYEGLMDNVKVEPIAPNHEHKFADGNTETRVDATCTEMGYIDKGVCTVCSNVVKQVLPALGHDYGQLIDATEPTCTKGGYEAHYECAGCQLWFIDKDGDKVEVDASDIPNGSKLGHELGEPTITKAKEGVDGSSVRTCKREGCPGGKGSTETTVIPKAEIAVDGTSFPYTGKAIEPKVTVTAGGKALSADNYDISYSNNVNVGTGKVKIEFKGDSYEGTVEKTFEIKAPAVQASLVLDKSSVTLYTGDASNTETVKVKTITGATKTVTWKSGDDKVAKVDANGKITAVKAGTTTVTATANGITQKVTVTVKNPTITLKSGKKKFTKKAVTVKKKKKVTYTVSVSPAKSGMKLAKLTKKQTKIAKVTLSKKGKLVIQGKKKGSFKIKITSGKATKTLTIKVK